MLTSAPYLLIGHITADIMPSGRVLGGTVSFATPIVHAFGYPVRLLTSCATEEPLLDPLFALADVVIRPATHTTTFENIYYGAKRLQILHHVASSLDAEWIPSDWKSSKFVHLAPLVDDIAPEIASYFPEAIILLTPQGLMRQWGTDGVIHFRRWFDQSVLQAIDIVVMSTHDIESAPDLEEEFARCCKYLVVTNGAHGGVYYLNGQKFTYHAYPTIERNPTGAGDVFAVAVLASLPYLAGDMHRAIKFAAHLSALFVARDEPDHMLTPEQIQDVLASYRL